MEAVIKYLISGVIIMYFIIDCDAQSKYVVSVDPWYSYTSTINLDTLHKEFAFQTIGGKLRFVKFGLSFDLQYQQLAPAQIQLEQTNITKYIDGGAGLGLIINKARRIQFPLTFLGRYVVYEVEENEM